MGTSENERFFMPRRTLPVLTPGPYWLSRLSSQWEHARSRRETAPWCTGPLDTRQESARGTSGIAASSASPR